MKIPERKSRIDTKLVGLVVGKKAVVYCGKGFGRWLWSWPRRFGRRKCTGALLF